MAVGDAQVFPGFLTLEVTQLSFQSHRLLFSHASADVRGGNTPESSPQPGVELTTTRHECDTLNTEPPWRGFITLGFRYTGITSYM